MHITKILRRKGNILLLLGLKNEPSLSIDFDIIDSTVNFKESSLFYVFLAKSDA